MLADRAKGSSAGESPANDGARRIALISDVHGDPVALDAVRADIDIEGISEVYCLGDLVGYGPDPAGVIARMRSWGIRCVRGNYDDGIGHRRGSCGCYYPTEQARIEGAASYAFTDAALDEADHEWLARLPDEIRLEEGGARILLAHGSPRKINEYLLPDRDEALLSRLAEQAAAEVVCVGHVHVPYHRLVRGTDARTIHYVNSGSVGRPKDGDSRPGWVELVLGAREVVEARASGDPSVAAAGCTRVWAGAVIHRVAAPNGD